MRSVLVSALLALLAIPAFAAADGGGVPPAVQDLSTLVGRWKMSGKVNSGGKVSNVTGTYDCTKASAGFAVKCHFTMNGLPDGFVYDFDDLWGWSAGDGLVHWYTVTNAGETHDHKGSFGAKGGFVAFEGPQQGKLFSEQVQVSIKEPRTMVMTWTSTLGGEQVESGQLTFSRISAS